MSNYRWGDGSEVTPAELAQVDRCLAGLREYVVARFNLEVMCAEATKALGNFAAAWVECEERLTRDEARQIAEHPDLAEVNVRLDGWYG